jgi:hypothetical protein
MLCTRFATIVGWYEYQNEHNQGTCRRSARNVWIVWRLTIAAGLRLEQVGDGLAEKVTVGRGAEISEVAE